MDDGVDSHRPDQLADQRVANVELQEIGVAEVVLRLPDVDGDDLLDGGVVHQALDEESPPPAGDAGDQDATLPIGHVRNPTCA